MIKNILITVLFSSVFLMVSLTDLKAADTVAIGKRVYNNWG